MVVEQVEAARESGAITLNSQVSLFPIVLIGLDWTRLHLGLDLGFQPDDPTRPLSPQRSGRLVNRLSPQCAKTSADGTLSQDRAPSP